MKIWQIVSQGLKDFIKIAKYPSPGVLFFRGYWKYGAGKNKRTFNTVEVGNS